MNNYKNTNIPKLAKYSSAWYECYPAERYCLGVVGSSLGGLLGLEHDVLDNDLSVSVAGELDPGSVGLQDTRGDEEVVDVTLGGNPSLALVGADLQALGAAGGVLDGGGEPVLRGTTVHVDAEGIGDGTLDELPLDTVDTTRGQAASELRPGGRGHVKVVLVAIGLVGNLFGNRLADVTSSVRSMRKTHHHNDLLALVRDTDATTTVVAGVPELLRHAGGTINSRRQNVVGKSTGTLLPAVLFLAVEAVSGAHANVERTSEQVTVGGRVGAQKTRAGLQREGCKSQSGGKKSRHFVEVRV
jgi:hypothetical protein